MPSPNTVKNYAADSYYHVYNRGVAKCVIFEDEQDYRVFLSYLKVALTPAQEYEDETGISEAPNVHKLRRLHLDEEVELPAFCLMPNHFHLLLYQHSQHGIPKLMQSIMAGYVRYFNTRHDRVGSLFQSRYKAAHVDNEAYLWHITRYIHLNPADWQQHLYSSYGYYTGEKQADWVNPDRILQAHQQSGSNYQEFVADHQDYRDSIAEIEQHLADI